MPSTISMASMSVAIRGERGSYNGVQFSLAHLGECSYPG